MTLYQILLLIGFWLALVPLVLVWLYAITRVADWIEKDAQREARNQRGIR